MVLAMSTAARLAIAPPRLWPAAFDTLWAQFYACTHASTDMDVQAVTQTADEQTHRQACRLINTQRVTRQHDVVAQCMGARTSYTSFFVHVHRGT